MEVVGIDVSERSVRAARLRQKGGGLQLVGFWEEPFSRGLANTETDNVARREAITRVVGKALSRGARVRVSLASSSLIFRELTLPYQTRDQLNRTVKFALEEFLPFPVENVAVDYVKLRNLPDGKSQVFSVAGRKEDISDLLAALASKGIDPVSVEVNFFSLVALLRRKKMISDAPVVVVEIDETRTSMLVIDAGELRLIRVLPFGYGALIEDVSESMRITLEQAESVCFDSVEDAGEVPQDIASGLLIEKEKFNKRLVGEIVRSLRSLTLPREPFEIYLAGGGSLLNGVEEYISKQTRIPTSIIRPLEDVDDQPGIAGTLPGGRATLAVSLALQEFDNVPARVNLRQDDLSFKGTFKQVRVGFAFLLILLTIGFSGIGAYFHYFWKKEAVILKKVLTDKEELYRSALPNVKGMPTLEKLKRATAQNEKDARTMAQMFKLRHSAVYLWKQVVTTLKKKDLLWQMLISLNGTSERLDLEYFVDEEKKSNFIEKALEETGVFDVKSSIVRSERKFNDKALFKVKMRIDYKQEKLEDGQ